MRFVTECVTSAASLPFPRGCDGFFISCGRIGPSLAGRGGETGQIVRMPRSPTLRVMIRVGSSTVGWTTERLPRIFID